MMTDQTRVQMETQRKIRTLSELELFADMLEPELVGLTQAMTGRHARKGEHFYRQGDQSETVYILQAGRVQLYRINPDGRKLIVAMLQPHAMFDVVTVTGPQEHTNFAEALEPCTVFAINPVDLVRFLYKHPKLLIRLLETTTQRLSATEERLESLAFKGIPARLSALLLELAREQDSTTIKGFTHQDLADFIGTYRETATQVLSQLKALGCVTIQRKQIDIINVGELEMIGAF